MSKAKQIASGWKNVLKSKFGLSTEEEETLFKARLEICKACDHGQGSVCNKCGCPLVAKTKSLALDNECPDKLW